MSWLWPDSVDPEPNFGQRLGRLAHWTLAGLGALLGAGAVVMALTENPEVDAIITLVVVGFAFALIGRGLRYLFGGE